MAQASTEVLICGAGPAGLSLAIELGTRGVRCLIVDPLVDIDPHPRASLLGPRSMEYFRRHGLDKLLLQNCISTELPYEVRFVTGLAEHTLYHKAGLSHQMLEAFRLGEFDGLLEKDSVAYPFLSSSPYTLTQIGQNAIETILRERVATLESITTAYGSELIDFSQSAGGVEVVVRNESGSEQAVCAHYLAACDGGRSKIRKKLGIKYSGRGPIGRNKSYLIRSDELKELEGYQRANLHFVYREDVYGVLTDIDGKGLYTYSYFAPKPDKEEDPAEVFRKAIGKDCKFDILRSMDWSHHQSVADKFREGRIFILGDAAHVHTPSGGIGMNTAISDAFDLGWKLEACLGGWGGEGLLDSYEKERWQVAMRNTQYSAINRDRFDAGLDALSPEVYEDSQEGEAARQATHHRFDVLMRSLNSMGAHLGLRYADSPIVIDDGTAEPPDDTRVYVPSTWPGCRAPHCFITPDESTLDLFDGNGFVLVNTGDESVEANPMLEAATELGIPLRLVSLSGPAADLYQRRWVLVRPDGHVCWRAKELPLDPSALLLTVTGNIVAES